MTLTELTFFGIILVLLFVVGYIRAAYKQAKNDLEFEKASCKRFRDLLEQAELDISSMKRLTDNIPEDCKRGTWCKECAYSGVWLLHGTSFSSVVNKIIFCQKADVCKNFVPKGDLKDGN